MSKIKFKKVEKENPETTQRFDSVEENWVITEDEDGKWAAFKFEGENEIVEEIGTGMYGPDGLQDLERILDFEIEIVTPKWKNLDEEQKNYFINLVRDYLEETKGKDYEDLSYKEVKDNLKDASAYYNTDEPEIAFV